jgi:segregation and condensation protein B
VSHPEGAADRPLVAVGPGPSQGSAPVEGEGSSQAQDAGATPGASGRPVTVADVEALLFVAERPLSRRELAGVCGVDAEAIDALLGDLEVSLGDRGIRLVSAGERVELTTAPESGELIARYLGIDQVRLSAAALETLAIVAYRQPVTRGVIERIRGVDSDHVVRGLLHRRLIVEQGRADTPGRPILYGTGLEFMERFGLTSLDDLPPLDAEVAARLVETDDGATDASGRGAAAYAEGSAPEPEVPAHGAEAVSDDRGVPATDAGGA